MRLLYEKNGILVMDTPIHYDERGHFRENWRTDHLIEAGVPKSFFEGFMQNNVSVSHKGVIRGMHCQGWSKLMTVATGSFRMVFVDLRPESKTFCEQLVVDVYPGMCVYVPSGVANGAQALEDNSVLNYIVTGAWEKYVKYTCAHPLSDELIDKWLPVGMIVSEKDQRSPMLSDVIEDVKLMRELELFELESQQDVIFLEDGTPIPSLSEPVIPDVVAFSDLVPHETIEIDESE